MNRRTSSDAMTRRNFPELKEWATVRAPITEHLAKFVRALVVSGRGSSLEAYASAVAAVYQGRPVLLTAKHVLDRLAGRRLFLETPDEFRQLDLPVSAISENGLADAVVIHLPPSAFQWQIDFVDLRIQFEPELGQGEVEIFLAMGFPWKESAIDYRAKTLNLKRVDHWSFEHRDACRLLRLPADLVLTTRFDTKNAVQDGMIRQMKLPEGMSGGAVWRLWGPDNEYPSLSRGALAGIITEYHRTPAKCLVSARVRVFQTLALNYLEQG